MPAKAKGAKAKGAKKKSTPTTAFIPAHTQLKEYVVELPEAAAAIYVPLGSIVHWPQQSTRPVIKSDVMAKVEIFAAKDGWHSSYNVMSRILTKKDRVWLESELTAMATEEGTEHGTLWRHSMFHKKVRVCVCVYMCLCMWVRVWLFVCV
jgi:hypothetical protein